jgi:hypothetical protein
MAAINDNQLHRLSSFIDSAMFASEFSIQFAALTFKKCARS